MKKEQENNKRAAIPANGGGQGGVNWIVIIPIMAAIIGGIFGMTQFYLPCYVLDGDGDSIRDCKDDCHNPGCFDIDAHGCPRDSDNDGVQDCDDDCPLEKGDIRNKGCPTLLLEITDPSHFSYVELKQIVRGTSQNIPKEQKISVIIYCHEIGCYYPQLDPIHVHENGEWSTFTCIGLEEDADKRFDIIVALADKKAQDALDEYAKKCEETKSYPGIKELPEGVVEYDRVSVIRLPCDTDSKTNIIIYYVKYEAEGNGKTDLNGEWVEILNISDQEIDMTGWKLYDRSNHVFCFEKFILKAGQSVIIYTGSGDNTASALYWNRGSPVWNDGGDCAYLADKEGNVVHEYCWP